MYNSPVITFVLIVVTCIVSYQGFKSFSFERKYIFNPEAILAGKEFHRVVTSAFLHSGWQHLILNMFSLYFFGRYLEFYLGPAQYLIVYFGSIVGGSLLSLFVHRHHVYYAYGASGGVCGVIFSHILLSPGGGIQMFYLPISVPGWLYAIGFILYSFLGMKEHRDDVGHDAHLGGAIIGFLITAGLHPSAVRNSPLIFSIVLASAILLLLFLWFNPLFLPMVAFVRKPLGRKSKQPAVPSHKVEALQVDRILDKIARSGIESLTAEEKKVLDEASDKYRRRSDSKKPESGLAI